MESIVIGGKNKKSNYLLVFMKVIFLASLRSSSASGRQRLWALQQCGVNVSIIDKDNYSSKLGRLAGYLGKLCQSPKLLYNTSKLQQDLINFTMQIKPDVIWLEWAKELQPAVLMQLQKLRPRPFLISFQDDNPWGDRRTDSWMWRDYFRVIPNFDMHLVKRPIDIKNLNLLGAKSCRIWRHGLYKLLFYPPSININKIYPVSFVGTCMDQRVELIKYLLEHKLPVHVFGNRWDQRSDLPMRFPANFHPAVEGEQYAEVIRKSQICLGLVSHSNHDEWTMRTYEVPGCAGLLLAERTPTHEELFLEGKEAVFFSTPQECASKLLDLLKEPELCRSIGEAAYQKCLLNNWTLEGQMQELLYDLQKRVDI
ncbi:CgeB family protein [Adhaeribacter radiodurans]|uniref:Glycosyltransferase n=1 Tax=Adhaeribacter radiodurans TaxID=2745197 RepID=A0A7L7L4X0_9BACT|nr:glycosyltransferase [Adhaeribacter radiodurans]QMU27429.1 glycosyltransferase [Adhaeribacter radiodurans]